MDLFDSPLFWIILVWWLISTVLGAQARKRRREQAAAAQQKVREQLSQEEEEQPDEPASVAGPEWRESPEVGEVRPAQETGIFPPRQKIRRPASLTDIWREMQKGLTPTEIQPSPWWEAEELEKEAEPEAEGIEAAAQGTTTYMEMLDIGAPVPSKVTEPEKVPVTIRDRFMSLDLNSWQQAVVLKEVLDRPRAYRRQIR